MYIQTFMMVQASGNVPHVTLSHARRLKQAVHTEPQRLEFSKVRSIFFSYSESSSELNFENSLRGSAETQLVLLPMMHVIKPMMHRMPRTHLIKSSLAANASKSKHKAERLNKEATRVGTPNQLSEGKGRAKAWSKAVGRLSEGAEREVGGAVQAT